MRRRPRRPADGSESPAGDGSVSAHGDISGIASTGDYVTNVQAEQATVNVGPGRAAVRSAYRKQVERIVPPELVGREAELRELAAYCTEPGRGPYVWWRAPAWAGKSALLSTFVLHPPAGVRVVSFFVTARFAGQSDRTAFLEVVLEVMEVPLVGLR